MDEVYGRYIREALERQRFRKADSARRAEAFAAVAPFTPAGQPAGVGVNPTDPTSAAPASTTQADVARAVPLKEEEVEKVEKVDKAAEAEAAAAAPPSEAAGVSASLSRAAAAAAATVGRHSHPDCSSPQDAQKKARNVDEPASTAAGHSGRADDAADQGEGTTGAPVRRRSRRPSGIALALLHGQAVEYGSFGDDRPSALSVGQTLASSPLSLPELPDDGSWASSPFDLAAPYTGP
jgi:hypothetical protein